MKTSFQYWKLFSSMKNIGCILDMSYVFCLLKYDYEWHGFNVLILNIYRDKSWHIPCNYK